MNVLLVLCALVVTSSVMGQDATQLKGPVVSPMAQIYARVPQIPTVRMQQDRATFNTKIATSEPATLINDLKQLANDYQQILLTYQQMYDAARLTTNPFFMSPMTLLLHEFYNELMRTIKMRADLLKKMTHKKFDDQVKDINGFLLILDTCDALASSMANAVYKDQAPTALKYYKNLQAQYLLDFLTSFLSTIQELFAKSPQSLPVAQQIYNHALNYWHEYAEMVGIKKSTPTKEKLVTAMSRIYDRNAETQLRLLDFKKNSVAQNKKIYNSVIDDYNHAVGLFQSIGNKHGIEKTKHLLLTVQSQSVDYDRVQKIYSDGMRFVSQKTVDAKKRGLSLLQQAQKMFKHIGDDSSQHTANYFVTLTTGDIGIMEGQAAIQKYSSNAAGRASSNKIINAAIQSGIVQGADQNLINSAAQSFAQAYTAYKKIALNYYNAQTAQPMVSVDVAGALNDIAANLATAHGLRVDGDTAAQLLTAQGLLTAQQKYAAARQAYMMVDRGFSSYMSKVLPIIPFYPSKILNDQHTYLSLFNDYIGQFFIQICQPITTTQPDLVLQYYALIASQNVDMSAAIDAIKTGVDFLATARKAADQARLTGQDPKNWIAQQNVQGYESAADDAWHKALSLYDATIQDGRMDAVNEYVSFAHEYAEQYIQHVPEENYPLLGALYIYYHMQQLLRSTPEQTALTTISSYTNDIISRINTLLSQYDTQVTNLFSQKSFDQALKLQQRILAYYNATYPGTNTRIVQKSDAEVQAANLKAADLASSWGGTLLSQKDYKNAYANLSQAYMIYQAQGTLSQQLKQQYFLARTLSTAQEVATTVYTQDTARVGNFTVPKNYFLQEYLQQIPQDVPMPPENPSQNDLKDLVRSIFIAYYLTDAGSSYAQVYTSGTRTRISGLDTDTSALADAAEAAADKYQKKYMANADYSIELTMQNNVLIVKELHKQVPALDSPYSNAPTAVGYYMAALSLYRPGTSLVTLNGQTFVPGQDSDDAWDMCKAIAMLFLSDAVHYIQAIKTADRNMSLATFNATQNNLNEVYNRAEVAHDYLAGMYYADNFQDVSKFAADAQYMNLFIADQISDAINVMQNFVNDKDSIDDLKTIMDTLDKNSSLSRQYYKTYYAATGVTDEYTIAQVVDLIINLARFYEKAGDICLTNKKYFKATPFLSTAQYYYKDLISNNVSKDVKSQLDGVTIKLNKAYFYGAADSAVQYFWQIKKPLVNGLTYQQLLKKRDDADNIDSGIVMTSEEFDAYTNIEGLILDAIMYYMLVSDNWSKLIDPIKSKAMNTLAQTQVNNFLLQHNLRQDQLTGSMILQELATKGYEQFAGSADKDLRYLTLSSWAGQLYFALASTYNSVYLAQVPVEDQWTQLKDRIDARLQAVSYSS